MNDYFAWFFGIGSLLTVVFLALHTYFDWKRRQWQRIEHERRIRAGWQRFGEALARQVENERPHDS